MRILIVEDEHKIANSIKKGLEQESYAVDVAYDGSEGYDLADGEEFDVIILDIMLPRMDGLSICKSLRQNNNHTPILLLTAKGQLEDKVNGLNCGVFPAVLCLRKQPQKCGILLTKEAGPPEETEIFILFTCRP
ncbi:hypothetical protein COS55_01680 [Candidatus Shapirobacteria bacterium CG03_land_8_20_14_0_80_40_19]|uniref:Response regulatory domain-containing protein n=4 Tax=Candidatus Shapironibacteriota TaxID=1752721 RepID=A0A2M7BEK0_9BACT|nr:MAG: hypothetical protein COV89_00740 [Candidatus Shapirobacteria bacterium CG11_big_fil_rev_8_21_14_0_20_40_12]PIV01504.1 MAG: hypothetical protein COS55_01680 [Candidatus Shapirobacteria bacterium CG03_land_8_20_14_0_80_40_19]PJC28931.1 MAG: hypothetical protein CO053_01995 [Candidatus Shapirobacteria bacterium CG_4_9_14_0_2_um_filter_40_11]PJC76033.1 MAG: hypothetical protein CO010_03795 [Candidatus Shapirobacteria bacterium CG_4_8_14_3_um_filter_39_11]